LEPLARLTGKQYNVQLDWGENRDRSLEKVKEVMSSKPELKLADLSQEFIIQCEASNSGIGGTLLQMENGVNHPIRYASRKVLPREQKYTTGEKVFGSNFHN